MNTTNFMNNMLGKIAPGMCSQKVTKITSRIIEHSGGAEIASHMTFPSSDI